MRIPAFLFGTQADVSARCRQRVQRLAKGATWSDAVADEIVEPAGLIMLQSALPRDGLYVHELVSAINRAGAKSLPDELLGRIFPEMIANPWSLLGLFGQEALRFFALPGMPPRVTDEMKANRLWPFVDAVASAWPVLDGEGARYSMGSSQRQRLWALPTQLKTRLIHLGVSEASVRAPLGAEGVRALVPPRSPSGNVA